MAEVSKHAYINFSKMKIAIIQTGGKQYKVAEGDVIDIEKIEGEEGGKVEFENVLFLGDENEVKVGSPVVEGAKAEGLIEKQFKDKKVMTIKHRAKKRYLKKIGHRQELTKVKITKLA